MLGRFGDVPIGYYNGTADISIPLYTIKEGNIEIPVTLSYHSSGIKVEDEATWVGLGWSLDPGGAVIKTINGGNDSQFNYLRDEDSAGFDYLMGISITGVFSQTQTVGNALWDCFPNPFDSTYPTYPGDTQIILNSLLRGNGQPDTYQYSLPGGVSGKFYINPGTHKAVLIDKKSDIQINIVPEGYEIITMDGNKYYFSVTELSYTALNAAEYTGETF